MRSPYMTGDCGYESCIESETWTTELYSASTTSASTSTSTSTSATNNNASEWPTIQENGQRKYGPPAGWTGPPPPKGTEVFVKRIPRRCLEDELCTLLSGMGTIYTFRLMMDFSGTNRGFAFVQYATREEAMRAIEELNNYAIRPGESITLEESKDNCRLFIGHIPKHVDEAMLKSTLKKRLSHCTTIYTYMSVSNRNENRGFCFVDFEDHRWAAMSRRELLNKGIPDWGSAEISVDWAVPEKQVPPNVMEKVTTLYIRNLPGDSTANDIKMILYEKDVNLKFVSKIKIINDFAFVHFVNRHVAEFVLEHLNGLVWRETCLIVDWAKPPPAKTSEECSPTARSPRSRSRGSKGSSANASANTSKTKPRDKPQKNKFIAPVKPLGRRDSDSDLSQFSSNSRYNAAYESAPRSSPRVLSSNEEVLHLYKTWYTGPNCVTWPLPKSSPEPQGTRSLAAQTSDASCLSNNAFEAWNGFEMKPSKRASDVPNEVRKFDKDPVGFGAIGSPVPARCTTRADDLYAAVVKSVLFMCRVLRSNYYTVLSILAESHGWGNLQHRAHETSEGWIVQLSIRRGLQINHLWTRKIPQPTLQKSMDMAAFELLEQLLDSPQALEVFM